MRVRTRRARHARQAPSSDVDRVPQLKFAAITTRLHYARAAESVLKAVRAGRSFATVRPRHSILHYSIPNSHLPSGSYERVFINMRHVKSPREALTPTYYASHPRSMSDARLTADAMPRATAQSLDRAYRCASTVRSVHRRDARLIAHANVLLPRIIFAILARNGTYVYINSSVPSDWS